VKPNSLTVCGPEIGRIAERFLDSIVEVVAETTLSKIEHACKRSTGAAFASLGVL
jgi:hypothetical protein